MNTLFQKIYLYICNRSKSVIVKLWGTKDYNYRSKYNASFVLNLKKDVDRYFFFDAFEDDTLKLFQDLVNQNDIVVDVGANIGIYSVLASKKNSTGGKVISFEPSDWAHSRLLKNIERNGCGNVSVYKNAVSRKTETLQFHVCEDDAYNSIGAMPMLQVKTIKTIEAVALDEFLPSIGISKVDVLKIDTEGADYLVLMGFGNYLRKDDAPIVFCEYNRNITSGYDYQLKDLYMFLISLGFTVYELDGHSLKIFDPETSNSNEIICTKPSKDSILRTAVYEKTISR